MTSLSHLADVILNHVWTVSPFLCFVFPLVHIFTFLLCHFVYWSAVQLLPGIINGTTYQSGDKVRCHKTRPLVYISRALISYNAQETPPFFFKKEKRGNVRVLWNPLHFAYRRSCESLWCGAFLLTIASFFLLFLYLFLQSAACLSAALYQGLLDQDQKMLDENPKYVRLLSLFARFAV